MAEGEQRGLATHAEAAQMLGCGASNVPKPINAGRLRSHGRRGPGLCPFEDADVKQLAEHAAREAAVLSR